MFYGANYLVSVEALKGHLVLVALLVRRKLCL